jgi:hypothetical protein
MLLATRVRSLGVSNRLAIGVRKNSWLDQCPPPGQQLFREHLQAPLSEGQISQEKKVSLNSRISQQANYS